MIEKTTHPAGFKVTDRRGEHAAPPKAPEPVSLGFITEEIGPDSPQVSPGDFVAGTGVTVDKPGWYHLSGGFPAGRKRQVRRSGPDVPPPPPTLADVRYARSVLAGARGDFATPLTDNERFARYCAQNGTHGGSAHPVTPRQRRRLLKKLGQASARYLTSTADVK